MALRTVFALSLAALLLFGGESTTFISITNKCGQTIWPAAQVSKDSPAPSPTGFDLPPGASKTISFDSDRKTSGGRIWARTFCGATCLTGECGHGGGECNGNGGNPPVTLVEFTLHDGGKDTYDVSNVDGFNLPVRVAAINLRCRGRTCTVIKSKCPTRSCAADVNADCPKQLKLPGQDGATIGCKSACAAFNRDEDCCRGAFAARGSCHPSNYSMYFKNKCPDAYSYAHDDQTSTSTCTTGRDYHITFCP